jgi:hypothetical protein
MNDPSSPRTKKNAPIAYQNNAHKGELVHAVTPRKYINASEVKELAKKKYEANGQGICIMDLQATFKMTKRQAQRQLKHLSKKKFLFTPDDLIKQGINLMGFRRERPQKYYLTEMKAKIIEDNKNNAHNDTTGIGPIYTQARENLAFIFDQLGPAYRYIHKLQIRTRINKEHYNELALPVKGSSKAKFRLERINQAQGPPDLEFNIYPNGTVMVFISCSGKPFRLADDDDIFAINAYLGRVEDRLKNLFSDTRNSIIPPSSTWILVGCDINKDIQINDMAQLTGINIQLKSALGVFRAYVKRIEDKAVYRNELSLVPNEPVSTAFGTLRRDAKIDKDSLSL